MYKFFRRNLFETVIRDSLHKLTSMAQRSRKLALIMLPFLIVPYIIGFCIYAASGNKTRTTKKAALTR